MMRSAADQEEGEEPISSTDTGGRSPLPHAAGECTQATGEAVEQRDQASRSGPAKRRKVSYEIPGSSTVLVNQHRVEIGQLQAGTQSVTGAGTTARKSTFSNNLVVSVVGRGGVTEDVSLGALAEEGSAVAEDAVEAGVGMGAGAGVGARSSASVKVEVRGSLVGLGAKSGGGVGARVREPNTGAEG